MKAAKSSVAQDTKKAVQHQFSHFYRVMGEKATGHTGNVLAVIQKGTRSPGPHKPKK